MTIREDVYSKVILEIIFGLLQIKIKTSQTDHFKYAACVFNSKTKTQKCCSETY